MKTLFSISEDGGQSGRRLVRLLFTVCLAAATWSGQVLAFDAKPVSVSDFQRTTFTTKEGAPDRTWAITQTSDGWLWFGGSTGITRFDGVEFEKIDVASADGRLSAGVSMLHALASGGLLIAHVSGGVSIYQRGTFTRFGGAALLAAGRAISFATAPNGEIWGAFESGLMRFDGTSWARIGQDWKFPSGYVQDVVFDGGGTLWVHAAKNVLRLRQGERSFERIAEVEEPSLLVQSPDGDLRLLGILSNAAPSRRWQGQLATASVPRRQPGEAFFDRGGNLWSQLLSSSGDAEFARVRVSGLAEFGVISQVFQDAEKNIWIAQIGKVHRLRSRAIVPVVDTREAVAHRSESSWINLASDKAGTIWFTHVSNASIKNKGTPTGTLWAVKDGAVPTREEGVTDAVQVTVDPGGNVWAAGVSGLWERQGTEFAKQAEFPWATLSRGSAAFAAVCSGGVWAAAESALRRLNRGRWQDGTLGTTFPSGNPNVLYCDKASNLWLGYGDGRVVKVDETLSATALRFVDLSIGTIASISVGRHTLVGGARGLAILGKDGFVRVSSKLPVLDGITGIVESPDGAVWLNGARGLIRVWASDLESEAGRTSGIRTQLFDADDGFPGPAYSVALPMSSLALDKDRRIWLSGLGGLGFIDTHRLPPVPPPPKIVFKSLVAGGRSFEATDAMSLPQGTRNLEIAYTALRSQHPDRMRFRYRLEGVDDGWVNVEERRRAFFTNLPPGKHRFQLDVSDELGSWGTQPTTLTFEIPPTFIQSIAFKLLCVAALLALLGFAYRLRVRHIERRHRQLLVERLDERGRIARELHDTLLQGTQALIMKVHAATRLVGKDEPIHQVLDKALDQATGVMVEARNRIEDLRVRAGPEDDDLPTVLVRFGQEQVQGGSPRFDAFVEGSPRLLVPAVLQEATLIGREALSNAFHHAKAATIELQVEFSDEHFRLRVRDDGLGFDDRSLTRPVGGRHWGLPGMQERARTISAAITIWSRPGAGTEVELRVPGKVAYLAEAPRRRWSTLRSALGYPT